MQLFIRFLSSKWFKNLSTNYSSHSGTSNSGNFFIQGLVASRAIGIMYKLRPFLPVNVLKNIDSVSHISSAIEIWGTALNRSRQDFNPAKKSCEAHDV